MDLTFSPQESAFRDEIRAWLAANPPSPDDPTDAIYAAAGRPAPQ